MTPTVANAEANGALTLRLRQQELAASLANFSLQTDELQPVLDEACRVAAHGMVCTLAKVLEFLPGEGQFVMRAGIGWAAGSVGHARLGADLESPAGYAFHTGQPVLSNHLARETRFRTPALLVEHNVHRAFNVLVQTPTWRYGVLEVDSPDQRDFTLADTAFLQTLSATLAHAIQKQGRMAELRRSRAFAQGVLDASPDCVKVLSPDGAIRFMNRSGIEMNDLASFDDVRDRDFASLWPEAEQPGIRAALHQAAAGQPSRTEGFCPTAAGTPRWWELSFAPLEAEPGDPLMVIAVSRDVSDRRAAHQALRASEARLRDLNAALEHRVEDSTRERDRVWELSEDLLVIADYEGRLIRTSPSWTRLFGHDPETLAQTAYHDLIHPEDLPRVGALLDTMRSEGQPIRFENRVRAADGHWRWIAWTLSPEPGGHRMIGVGRDVTAERHAAAQRDRLEDQLRQSQKMEAVGQLTGGLAHDFNNLLTGISGSLELLSTRIGQGRLKDVDRYVTAAQGAARRAASLTHRLLAFSRRQTLEPRLVQSEQLVAGMMDLVRRTVGPAVTLQTAERPGVWSTLCDPNQLENALLNLCINARDAMPGGGRITLDTANVDVDDYFALARDMPRGQYVAISVTDTGTGMAPDIAARAFDPFFTTKPLGEGTGLGLSMVYGFARQSGGQARIHSTEGVGTTVSLYLPRHQGTESPEASLIRAHPPAPAIAGETVLVVDDEHLVRMLVLEVLQEFGYAAVEAADGASGLAILQSDARIDLLVTDVGLPGGMNGRQMADAARLARPGLKVLFITGYAEAAVFDEAPHPGMRVLTKPFALETLAARIKDLLAG